MSNTHARNDQSDSCQMNTNGVEGNRGTLTPLRESAQRMAEKTSSLACQATEKTEGAISAMGERINHLGDRVRETLPDSGSIGSAAAAVADSLNSSGKYLETHGFEDMAKDLTEVVKRHPMPAVWVGVGAGFLLGWALHRRN